MQDKLLWTEKYFPKALNEFIGNSEIVERTLEWAEAWNKGFKQKPLLFYGATGAGKTCLGLLLARINAWDLFELNSSDMRDKETIERLCGAAAFNSTFSGKLRLVLLDEIDGLQSRDTGGYAAITKILKESENPVILTANDIYADQKMALIRPLCECLQFKKINYLSIAKFLKNIALKESVIEAGDALKLLAKNSSGDLRSAILDLQCLALDDKKVSEKEINSLHIRERPENIFNVLRKIFKARNFFEVRQATAHSEVDSDMLQKWIEENIPAEFNNKEMPKAFEMLSKADVFNGRIMGRQHWGFKRYSNDLSTAGVVLCRENPERKFVKYNFPGIIKALKASSAERQLKKQVASKIAGKVHSSSKAVIREDLPFISFLAKNKQQAAALASLFDFDEKEIAFLIESKPDSLKVKEILEKAFELKQELVLKKRKFTQALTEQALQRIEQKIEAEKKTNEILEGQGKLF